MDGVRTFEVIDEWRITLYGKIIHFYRCSFGDIIPPFRSAAYIQSNSYSKITYTDVVALDGVERQ